MTSICEFLNYALNMFNASMGHFEWEIVTKSLF